MSLLNIVVLAVVQGITEFLPISSSGHLVAIPWLTGWPDQGPLIDVAVHVGTLAAVVGYFHADVGRLFVGLKRLMGGEAGVEGRLVIHLLVATVPAVAVGGSLAWFGMTTLFRDVEIMAWATLLFGVVLFVTDRTGMTVRRVEHLEFGSALAIGIAQVLAFIPGTSRSGITITAARALGFERSEAARFSMLLSIPTLTAAGTLAALKIAQSGDFRLGFDAVLAALFAFLAALAAIAVLMAWLRRATFTPFVIYRVLIGTALLVWIYR